MNQRNKRRTCVLSSVLALGALGVAACSQGASPGPDDSTFDDTTGAVVAQLSRIPDDVRCIEIQTSDPRRSNAQFDVQPGAAVTLRIAPLTPGWLTFSGTAYGVACANVYHMDAGPTGHRTWVADTTSALVNAGRPTPISLTFRRLGSAEISVDFSDCGLPNTDAGCVTPPGPDAAAF